MDSAPLEITVQLLSVIPRTVIVHVPLRDATVVVHDTDTDHVVSIHAPQRGATLPIIVLVSAATKFQSTHPCGVRHYFNKTSDELELVSIHAPLRGATASTSSKQSGQ